jgi:hypothetical protein
MMAAEREPRRGATLVKVTSVTTYVLLYIIFKKEGIKLPKLIKFSMELAMLNQLLNK